MEIVARDSQSNVDRAADLARDLIVNGGIQLMVVAAGGGDGHPGQRPVRGQRHAVPLHRDAVAAVVLRPGRPPGRALPLDLQLLLGPGPGGDRVRGHVGPGAHEQGVRRALARRLGRPGLGRPDRRRPGRGGPPRLRLPRRRSVPRRDAELHPADRHLPGRPPGRAGRGARHHGLHRVLAAGHPARLPAEDRDDRQGAAVPVRRGGAGPARGEPGHRGLVVPAAPVHLVADRADRAAARRRLHGGHRPAVDPAARLRARPVRGGRAGVRHGPDDRRPRRAGHRARAR